MICIVGHNASNQYESRQLQSILADAAINHVRYNDHKGTNIVVALGDSACKEWIPGWPDKRSIQTRRGYMWEGAYGKKVMAALPMDMIINDRSGVSEMLIIADFIKAKEHSLSAELVRPIMNVSIVRTPLQASTAAMMIRGVGSAAVDIEITRSYPFQCLCVGFATSENHAYVFTQPVLGYAFKLLEDPLLHKVLQNAQFDLHFLLTRHSCRVMGQVDDTIVAWHSRWPEIAGAKTDLQGNKKAGIRRTRKSLLFFGSLFSNAEYWKDYDVDEEGMYILNGKDCCITLMVWNALKQELEQLDLMEIYDLTRRRIWPVVEMQARGLLVDESLRINRITQLSKRRISLLEELQSLARPLLEERRERVNKPHLIWQRVICKCCRNGKSQRMGCIKCSGLPPSPKVADLRVAALSSVRKSGLPPGQKAAAILQLPMMKKAELAKMALIACKVCDGKGQWEEYAFNPASDDQLGTLLYDVLKLPRREGVDESSLKGLLGWISGEMRQLSQVD